ncbi:MAG: YgiQ family radical SAM protein [Eubacterium sp.]
MSIFKKWLPTNQIEMEERGWDCVDFVLVTGDGYVDHPSFGAAIISRLLEHYGYRVGIIAQPNWQTTKDFQSFGKPKLGFLVTAGNLDSMVSHYTVNKKRRRKDVYTPGGVPGKRPDRATIVYCGRIREAYKEVPIIIGGIEASLRRFAHYDYWQDAVRRSILFDSRADILVYGMGEKAIIEIADSLKAGLPASELNYIKGSAAIIKEMPEDVMILPSYEQIKEGKTAYAKAAALLQQSNDPFNEKPFVQACGNRFVIQNAPQMPLSETEMDDLYELPYCFLQYEGTLKEGEIPGIEEVKFSITANRGCFGNCNFCALAIHQGRYIQKRSKASIVAEAERMTKTPDFKGYIHDIGGPTANFRNPACEKQKKFGVCKDRECLYPKPCKNLDTDESDYLDVLRTVRQLPGVKKVFVRSGVRYDYMLKDKDQSFFRELVKYHVSGQLRVAPEHVDNSVLKQMGKPSFDVYEKFVKAFEHYDKKLGSKQYVVPYFISGHPGCTLKDAVKLSEYIRDTGSIPEQVQDFYPTPGSIATAMYYTGLNPFTMESMHIPKDREKLMQRALIQYNNPENYQLVYDALIKVGRGDLIGKNPGALIGEPQTLKAEKKFDSQRKITKGKGKNSPFKNKKKTGGKNGKKTN